ncbi:MAG: ABC transporter permease [Prevotella sp.]|nr:ABC transporter permease [Prevotella sp.]
MGMRHLIKKEIIQIRRNSFLPKLIIVFPIMIMCVMPWVMDMEVRNINVVVVDHDHSTMSNRMIHRLGESKYFIFKGMRESYEIAINDVEKGDVDVIVEIPEYYEKDVKRGNIPAVLIAANAVNGTKGSIGSSYMSSIVAQNLSEFVKTPISTQQTVTFSSLYLYNKHLNYKVFMIPALMSILMMMLCGFLPALNIVGEKEAGTIEQINVTPVSKVSFIFAKLIPYWCIGLFVLTVCFLLSWLIYGIKPEGNILVIYLISMLLALVFSGLGLIISNYSDTMQQAIFVIWFFVVCMMLLSGLFTPISSMPNWAQTITYFLPIRYYIDAMRTVFVRGGTLTDILPQTFALVTFALIMDVWAVLSYRKKS